MNGLTVKQVSDLSGVSIRTLQYYDNIGLLAPRERTEAGYRLYEEEQLATLQEILLFRELEFPLKEIKAILDSPAHDKEKALLHQVELLTLKKERLEGLIRLADDLRISQGENTTAKKRTLERKTTMDFKAFDKSKLEEYTKRAREEYSGTDAYKEYEVKSAGRTAEAEAVLGEGLMDVFREFYGLKQAGHAPESEEAQALVEALQAYITEHFYTCTPEILAGLGQMYAADGEFKENIDRCGEGTSAFVAAAIDHFTQRSA